MKTKRFITGILAGTMACSLALSGCGNTIDGEAVGATIEGEKIEKKEISLGFMNFMAKYQQAIYEGYFMSWYGTEMWSSDAYGDGSTMEESTKESILENIEILYLLEENMADYGVEISQDELDAMEKAAKEFLDDNSDKAIKQMGATQEYVEEMLRLNTIQYKMREAIYEEVDTEVSDEEAAQRTFSYIKIDIADGEEEPADTNDLAVVAKEVAVAAKQDFDKAAENGEYTVETKSYGTDEETMDEEVIAVADTLKEGDISDLITTESAYYILRLDSEFDEEKTEEKKESIVTERKTEYYTKVCDDYKENVEFALEEKEWEKVKFDRLFNIVYEEDEAELDDEVDDEEVDDTDEEE